MKKVFRRAARVALVSTFLVVLAGSVVRMTGSGMGCPDWPKCFGYIIPPTDKQQVTWQPNRTFHKGQMIVRNEAMWVASGDFTTKGAFNASNWQKYEQHDYSIFNAFHTWTEYINRLIGAFTGLPVLVLFFTSFWYWKNDKFMPLLSALTLFMLGFEAWLGKVVVDGNLIPGQITLHMFGALTIIFLLTLILHRTRHKEKTTSVNRINWLLGSLLILSILQVFLGTGVREEVDALMKLGTARTELIDALPGIFKMHRSFSIALVVVIITLSNFWRMHFKLQALMPLWIIVGAEILLGIILTYFDFPRFAQPAHLILAFFMAAYVFNLNLTHGFLAIQRSR